MRGYVVVAHRNDGSERRPIRAFAVLGENHQQAIDLVRQHEQGAPIDIDAVLHLGDETATRLQLTPGAVWRL